MTAASYGAVSGTTGTFTGVLSTASNLSVTGTSTLAAMTATTGSFSGALQANAGLTVTGGPITGMAGTFSGQVQSNGVNVRRMTGGVSGSITVPSNGQVAFSVTLDDAITPTRAVGVFFGTPNGATTIGVSIDTLGFGIVSGHVNGNSAATTGTVHVIAY